ncbi:MAG TPA: hypothetical protein VMF14_06490, partial [Solirubrobacteraceae bacterium]|nr:hypothetical protein [Solirubrobacteraceae bacterium]
MSIVRVRPVTRALVYVGAAWIIAWIGLTHLVTPPGGGTPGLAPARPATPDLGALRSLPLVAQSAISGTVGATEPRFAARRSGAGWQLRGGGVRAWFGAGPVRFSAGGGSAAMTATGASGRWTADGNRVSRANGWLREWYAAGPFGIEQGFTVAHRPASAGASRELTLAVAVGGSLRAQAAGSSIDFLRSGHDIAARYGGVTAVDATGRHLPASLRVRDGRVLITVDDRGARYPLTIDPLIQQGGKLTAGGESGPGSVGVSVALSADGNTALVGGDSDNGNNGAAWVFTRSGGTWSQQGAKLTGGGATAGAGFGSSVALSADGNTALIGGDFDGATGAGAAWVFTRSGSTWTQQGAKLTGPGATSGAGFGTSVALS